MTPVLYAKGGVKPEEQVKLGREKYDKIYYTHKKMLILRSSVNKGNTYASIRRSCIK